MKKFLSVILTVVMIATVFASVVVVNAADKLQIVTDKVEAEAGAEVKVNIKLVNNTEISALKMNLSCGDLEYVSSRFIIKPTEYTGNQADYTVDDCTVMKANNYKEDNKVLILNWAALDGVAQNDVTFAVVTFKVPENAANGTKYELNAEIDPENVFDRNQQNVDFEYVPGSVTVPGEPSAPVDTYLRHSLDSFVVAGKESKNLDEVTMKKGSAATILGWTVFTDGLKEMFYTVNGEEQACEDVYRDRADVAGAFDYPAEYGTHCGFGLDTNAMDLLGIDSLDLGTYTVEIGARANGGFEKILKTFTLIVVDETEPDPPPALEYIHTVFDAGAVENNTLVNAGGWTGATYPITRLGYQIDGGEPIFAGVTLTELPDSDPVKLPQNAGQYGVRFSIYRNFKDDGLSAGTHTVVLVAEFDDEAKTVLPFGNVASAVKNNFVITIEGEQPPAADPTLHSMSFNTVWVDGTQICDTGDALAYLAENPIDGDVQSLGLRGWARIADGTIGQFGYKIDGGEPVFDDAYLQQRADVQAAFGVTADVANGFNVNPIDVSALADGAHTVTVVVKTADGTVLDVVEVPFTITRNPGAPAYTLVTVNYDALYYDDQGLYTAGGVDKKVSDPELRSEFDFVKGTVSNIRMTGWVRISEDAADIKGFGYSIDGGAVVEGEFTVDRAAELANAGFPGGLGFDMTVPVADLEVGEHSIDVYVIAADGTQIKVVKDRTSAGGSINQVGVTFTISADETPTEPSDETTVPDDTTAGDDTPDNPGTSDTAVIALASVAAVALAGAFIGKKALKK